MMSERGISELDAAILVVRGIDNLRGLA